MSGSAQLKDEFGADDVVNLTGTPQASDVMRFGGVAVSLGQKTMASSMPVVIASDQSAIPVTISGGSSSIQYTEGDIDTSITGNALMWEDTADTLRVASAAKPLPVDIKNTTIAVTGTFWQATQPVSAASLPLPTGAATAALQTQPGVDIGDVTINNAAGASAVNIQDGGNSITVDGIFFQATQPVSAVSLPLPTGAATAALQTQPGVDIGDVTINNAAGASAVNIQDGGNSITVDGSVAVSGTVDTELTTADLDTGAGTDTRAVVGMVLAASGGGVLVGAANPMPVSDNGGSLTVDGVFFQATQPVSAASLPLPAGAATSALQTQPGVDIGDVTINNAAGASAVNIQDGGNSITVDGTFFQATQPVSAVSLPLPTGASTEATLSTLNTKIATAKTFDFDSGVGTDTVQAMGITVAASGGAAAITGDVANGLDVDVTRLPALVAGTANIGDVDVLTINGVAPAFGTGLRSATVQRVTIATDDSVPVTGTFWQATQPVSAASLPLPTGASTLAEQQTQTTALQLIDDTVYTTGVGTPAKGILALGSDGTNPRALKTDAAGELQIDVLTSALPSGAATAANQATEITSLQLLDDVVVAQGTALGTTKVSLGGASVTTANPAYTTGQIGPLSMTVAGELRVFANTESEAAQVLADSMNMPTTTRLGAYVMGFNGTTEDRIRTFSSTSTSLGYGSLRTAALSWAQIDGDDGKMYSIHTSGVTVNAAATVNVLTIKSSATKKLILDQLVFTGISTVALLWEVYLTPTVSVAGTAVTPTNVKQGGTAASVTSEKSATTSANGTLVYTAITNTNTPSFSLNLPTLAPLYTAPAETATWRVLVKCTNSGAANVSVYTQATFREN